MEIRKTDKRMTRDLRLILIKSIKEKETISRMRALPKFGLLENQ